jgi:hypothetical protein
MPMPNPFPGMNPFLEKPARWQSFHQRFITYLADTIDSLLPEDYSADIGEDGMTAVLEADPALEVEYWTEQRREPFIEVRMGSEPGRLISVIELLSPANKIPGKGRKVYLRKQARLLRSTTHLMEIDFLRGGEHTVAVQRDGLPDNGWDYVVCLHRGRSQTKFDCWPISLPERLPRVNVPLSGDNPDIVVDLQAVVNQCCESATGRRIDYSKACPPPLSKKNAKWIDELLRKKKLRK